MKYIDKGTTKAMNAVLNQPLPDKNDERDFVKDARQCVRIALRTIFIRSGHPRILEMFNSLYAVCSAVDSGDYTETVSDVYDLVSVAVLAILEYRHLYYFKTITHR